MKSSENTYKSNNNNNNNNVSNLSGIEVSPIQMPWMTQLEDQPSARDHLDAVFQYNQLDHYTRLNLNANPRPAKLTKIMVTMSVTNSYPPAIVELANAGVNIVRLNLSHNDHTWHAITVRSIREAGNIYYKNTKEIYPMAVSLDLRGPEIRTGIFHGDPACMDYAVLKEGELVRLLTDDNVKRAGSSTCFWVSYAELPKICQIGDRIVIDRGVIVLQVDCIEECCVICKILKGGILGNEKIVQLIDGAVPLPILSKQDRADIKLASQLEADFVIANNARNQKMMSSIKNCVEKTSNPSMQIFAKISSGQNLQYIDDILKKADGIVLERAGLEFDVSKEKLFLVQKSVIAKCNKAGKAIFVAFHPDNQLTSKINVELVENAVLDGIDGIFLATGDLNFEDTLQLVRKVEVACRIAECARWQKQILDKFIYTTMMNSNVTEAIAIGAVETSLKCNASAIIITTTTGRSAIVLSNYRPRCPIVAITRFGIVARFLQAHFAIHPYHYKVPPCCDWYKEMDARFQAGIDYLRRRNYIEVGNAIVLVGPSRRGSGFTNSIRVVYACPAPIKDVPHSASNGETYSSVCGERSDDHVVCDLATKDYGTNGRSLREYKSNINDTICDVISGIEKVSCC